MQLRKPAFGTQRVWAAAGLAMAAALGLSACDKINSMFNPAPSLKFGPYSEGYQTKPDFAQIESDFPLTIKQAKGDDDEDDYGTIRRYISGTGTIAGGKNRIKIETVNGVVDIW